MIYNKCKVISGLFYKKGVFHILQHKKRLRNANVVRENQSIYHFLVTKDGDAEIVETEFPILWETKQTVMVYDYFMEDYLKLSQSVLNIWITENQETVKLIRSVDMVRTTMCTAKNTNLLFSVFVKGNEDREELLNLINKIINSAKGCHVENV